jgi:predicted MFS family arabinose efflux permease
VYCLNYVDRQLLAVLAEPIRKDINLTDTQIGFLTGTVFALFYAAFGVPIAWLADRTKRTRIVAIACAMWSVFTAACGFAHNVSQLALARIGVGIGEAGGVAPSFSVIADYFSAKRRGTAIAVFTLATPIAGAVAVAWGAHAAGMFGWRFAFKALAIPGLLLALLLPVVIREPLRRADESGLEGSVAVPLVGTIRLILATPRLYLLIVGSCFSAMIQYVLLAWTPTFLLRVRGMSLHDLGSYYSIVVGLSVMCASLLSGVMLDRLRQRTPGAYGLIPAVTAVLALPFYAAALMCPSWQAALPLFAVSQFFTVCFQAPAVAAVQSFVPAIQRSTASSLFLLCINLAAVGFGPLYVGAVSDLALPYYGINSLQIALFAVIPMFLLAAVFNFLAARAMTKYSGARSEAA